MSWSSAPTSPRSRANSSTGCSRPAASWPRCWWGTTTPSLTPSAGISRRPTPPSRSAGTAVVRSASPCRWGSSELMAVTLETPLSRVLGPKTATSMAEQLALHTVRHLLRHYPRRYARRGEMARLDDLQVGDRVTILAQVTSVNTRRMRQRHGTITEVTVGDGAGTMKLVFFNYRHSGLKLGALGLFAGTVGRYQGQLQFTHPDMHLLSGDDDSDDDWARELVPIYPASKDVSSWVIQKSVKLLLDASGGFGELVEDPLPDEIRTRHGLPW